MNPSLLGLVNNILLLIALTVVYELSYSFPKKVRMFTPIINGLLIGVFAIAIMSFPFQYTTGIIFDTRTILLGVTALIFGGGPAFIAAAVAIVYRAGVGGDGVYMGIATIISSAAIGFIWKKFLLHKTSRFKWLNIYLCGLSIHAVMLLSMQLLPAASRETVYSTVSLPVIIIYPVIFVLLSLLLIRQNERSKATERILEAESRYKSLFEDNHAVMMLLDPATGEIKDANNAASQYYGWPVEQLKTMHISQINTLSKEDLQTQMKRSIEQDKNYFIFQHKKSSGAVSDVEVYSGPIKVEGQTLLYSIVHDISDRTTAIAALQESENRFRSLVEGAPDAIFIQADNKFTFINQAGLKLFGAQSSEELLGKSMMDFFHQEFHSVIKQRVEALKVQKTPLPLIEEKYLKVDGTPVWVEVQAIPIIYKSMDGAIVFARDLTEKIKLEQTKTEMEAQLRQQQKLEAIGTLAGGVAHEINNPINGIINYAQLILDAQTDSSPVSGYADEIIRESERISEIVKNLLQFSRIEKQSHSYASVHDIINQTVSLIRTIIKKDQIDFRMELPETLPDIKCRSQQIQQVLMNLLTNARDASNEKYPEADPNKIVLLTCEPFESGGRRWIRIVVEDHGNGVPESLQDKIFEPFFSTKTKDKGTGLGLSISFGIVNDHHGKLYLQTKQGEYAKFILELPVDNGWDLQNNE